MAYTFEHEIEINNDILAHLPNIKTVFDVGARDDVNYLAVKPQAEFHLFEPNPIFFSTLKSKTDKAILNNFGLGDKDGLFPYINGEQAFSTSSSVGNQMLPIKRLDWYLSEKRIKKIDFLKIDTEGYDYNVLVGLGKYLKNVKYIYYEVWNDQDIFKNLLKGFVIEPTGYRNYLCRNKKMVSQKTWNRVVKYIRSKKYGELV